MQETKHLTYKAIDLSLLLASTSSPLTGGIVLFSGEVRNVNKGKEVSYLEYEAYEPMANKKIENWILWIVGNLIVVPLYAYRGLILMSLQYLIFTILAIFAYLEWKKILDKN